MLTLFSEVKNIVNNHQLIYVSQDHEDLEALTPNHFLTGRNFYNDCLVDDIIVTRMYAQEKSGTKLRFYQIIFRNIGYMNICHLGQYRRNKLNLPYAHVWNTVVTSGLVPLVATWNC